MKKRILKFLKEEEAEKKEQESWEKFVKIFTQKKKKKRNFLLVSLLSGLCIGSFFSFWIVRKQNFEVLRGQVSLKTLDREGRPLGGVKIWQKGKIIGTTNAFGLWKGEAQKGKVKLSKSQGNGFREEGSKNLEMGLNEVQKAILKIRPEKWVFIYGDRKGQLVEEAKKSGWKIRQDASWQIRWSTIQNPLLWHFVSQRGADEKEWIMLPTEDFSGLWQKMLKNLETPRKKKDFLVASPRGLKPTAVYLAGEICENFQESFWLCPHESQGYLTFLKGNQVILRHKILSNSGEGLPYKAIT